MTTTSRDLTIVWTTALLVVVAATRLPAQRLPTPVPEARAVVVAGLLGIVAAGAEWTIAWQGTDNADGLIAADDGGVLFAQEQPARVRKLDTDDRVSVLLEDTRGTGALARDRTGRLLGVQRTCTDPGGKPSACQEPPAVAELSPTRRVLADSYRGQPFGRLNDIIADDIGGSYVTVGGVYYVSPRGEVQMVAEDIRSNGIMLSLDERVLYVTNGEEILAFDREENGRTGTRRTFARLEAGGTGDGMALDGDGRLYVTSQPGVQVFEPTGAYLGLIPTPRNAISVAFAGPGKQRLYVVGSGAIGADGREFQSPAGVRTNAKTIYRLPMIARGIVTRAK